MSVTTNLHLNFFDKQGKPLNFEYVGATGSVPAISNQFMYVTSSSVLSAGQMDLTSLSSGFLSFNHFDRNQYSTTQWAQTVKEWLDFGSNVTLTLYIQQGQTIEIYIDSVLVVGSAITVYFTRHNGNLIVSSDRNVTCKTTYENAPGGYFKGNIYFDIVSSGLFENQQIFVVQEFKDTLGDSIYGYPHSGITGTSEPVQWRTRWYNSTYGNVDISDIIFTYQITESDSQIDGDPSIQNYPNMIYSIPVESTDTVSNGYTVTSYNLSAPLTMSVALNASDVAAGIYERKLIVEQLVGLTGGSATKVIEIDFYGQIEGEDERFKVLLDNLGRTLDAQDSIVFRDHDPGEPLPNYKELNQKRKELLITGEDIYPYIGSYKGLINALNFFGYQDLRIKEYWLNLNYRTSTTPGIAVKENQVYLDSLKRLPYSNGFMINELVDNPNSGKFKMVQTYGPDSTGVYKLDVANEDTIVPSGVYKKTALFGLYYDINKVTSEVNEFGYPVVDDAFLFTQEEVLLKLFALKELLKNRFLPVNARIIDITGEGVYFNVYNTKSWSDVMDRFEIDLGNEIDFKVNPDFGYLEDLRNFGVRTSTTAIQTPMNYGATGSFNITVSGSTGGTAAGGAFNFSGVAGSNPNFTITRGFSYTFTNNTSSEFWITTDPGLTQDDPYGITNNGATGGSIYLNVNPQEQSTLYYYMGQNPVVFNGTITVANSSVSDLGNTVLPLSNGQQYSGGQNTSMITAISNFYDLKQNGKIIEFGDSKWDPEQYIDPATGQPWVNPVGMPLVLEYLVDRWQWDEMDVNWDSLYSPYSIGVTGAAAPNANSSLTWNNIDFSNYNEIEWIINKSSTAGNPYYFKYRGYIMDFYRMAHFVPYTGIYDVACNIYDGNNSILRKIEKQILQVSPKLIDLKAWTRYRQNEYYIWEQTIRDWDSYDSIWEYPAEGLTYTDLTKELPPEIIQYAFYGNNASEGEEIEVEVTSFGNGATGAFSLTSNYLTISSIAGPRIAGTQFGFCTVTTTTPHGLQTGDFVYITNSVDALNGKWEVIVPSSFSEYQLQIPYVLSPQAGVIVTLSLIQVDTSIYTSMKAVGEGTISVSVGGRVIGATAGGASLQSTVNSIVTEINNYFTEPDYFATTINPSLDPCLITISGPTSSGAVLNGVSLSVTASGSIQIVSSDSGLTGGINPATTYVNWDESQLELPNGNLRYWGTQNLTWDTFNESTWKDGYAHSWWDFEYDNTWLGGFEIHSSLVGDMIETSTGVKTTPFTNGVTFYGSGSTGASGYLMLKEVAEQLNNSDDSHLTNFYYRPFPSTYSDSLTITGPINKTFLNVSSPSGTYPAPPSVQGANPVLCVDFTYATGP